MKAEHPADLSCTFCGKAQREVRKLIAGPTIYICDECIKLSNDILAEEAERKGREDGTASAPKKKERTKEPGPKFCCSFCGKYQREVRSLIAGPSASICNECIGLCNDIIAEEIEREAPVAGLEFELPRDVRPILAGILERGLPVAVRIQHALYDRYLAARAGGPAAGEPPDEILSVPWDLAADWRGLGAILARTPPGESESGEEGPLQAEIPGWVNPIAERLTATLEVLGALARSLEKPGLEELRQLRLSVDVAGGKLREAREMLLGGPPQAPDGAG